MHRIACLVGLGILVLSTALIISNQGNFRGCIAGAILGFVLFIHESISEFSIRLGVGTFKIKQQIQQTKELLSAIQDLARPLTEFLYLSIGTRNLHPPGQSIDRELSKNLDRLIALCWPVAEVREKRLAEMKEKIEYAQKNWPRNQ